MYACLKKSSNIKQFNYLKILTFIKYIRKAHIINLLLLHLSSTTSGNIFAGIRKRDNTSTHVDDEGEGDDSDAHYWENDAHHDTLDVVFLAHTTAEVHPTNPELDDHGGVEDLQEPGGAPVDGRVGCHSWLEVVEQS